MFRRNDFFRRSINKATSDGGVTNYKMSPLLFRMVQVEMGQVCQMQDFFWPAGSNFINSPSCKIFRQHFLKFRQYVFIFFLHPTWCSNFSAILAQLAHLHSGKCHQLEIIKCIALICSFAEFSAKQILQ